MNPQLLTVFCLITICFLVQVSANGDNYHENLSESALSQSRLLVPAHNLTNLASSGENVLVLIPSGINLSDSSLNDNDFNLFKLNTDVLLNTEKENKDEPVIDHMTTGDSTSGELETDDQNSNSNKRESRKLNFLSNMWTRKTSPLYLVNGTVCRFINNAPICTTLSTTGLLPTGGGARPQTQGVSGQEGSVVQFDRPANQQNQGTTQRPRPAAVLDDDSQDINVESVNNATNDSRVVRGQSQNQQRPTTNVQATRPVNFVVSRRPLNLLALRRPVRHYPTSGGRLRETEPSTNQPGRRGGRIGI